MTNREKEFEEAYEATKDKVPSFNDEDWGVSLLKENLTWLDEHTPKETIEVPEFCDIPDACYHDDCSCERTNKGVRTNTYVLLEDIEGLGEKGYKFEAPNFYNLWEYVTDEGHKIIDLVNDYRIIKESDIIQVDKITEDFDNFLVFNEGGKCEFISQYNVIDVQTDEELTITQLETTDGTIYRT